MQCYRIDDIHGIAVMIYRNPLRMIYTCGDDMQCYPIDDIHGIAVIPYSARALIPYRRQAADSIHGKAVI